MVVDLNRVDFPKMLHHTSLIEMLRKITKQYDELKRKINNQYDELKKIINEYIEQYSEWIIQYM